MRAFTVVSGLAAPMDRANVDTDMIIPKQFLKSIKRSGFGPNCFDELRYLDIELAELDKPRVQMARMLDRVSERYDYVFLDCPPGITLTIDTALRATRTVLVPVIPAALPLRSFDQLTAYLRADKQLKKVEALAFLSMVDRRKKRHRELSEELPRERSSVLHQTIPSSVHIEAMAEYRAPVVTERPRTAAAESFRGLFAELDARVSAD